MAKAVAVSTATVLGVGGYIWSVRTSREAPSWPRVSLQSPPQSSLSGPLSSSATSELGVPVIFTPTGPRGTTPAPSAANEASVMQQCRELTALGLPSNGEVRCYAGGYLADLNYERRIPNWVLEIVDYHRLHQSKETKGPSASGDATAVTTAPAVSRSGSSFYADTSVPSPFRVGPSDYTTRGLSRGHLAAAQFHKSSQADMDATFNMNANIVPQDMTLNAVDWLRLEGMTRKLSKEVASDQSGVSTAEGGKLYVVSGPAFLPRWVSVQREADGTVKQEEVHCGRGTIDSSAASGPSGSARKLVMQYDLTGDPKKGPLVAVPTHLFKVVVAERATAQSSSSSGNARSYEAAAFLLPNKAIAEERPLTAYQVPIAELEKVTGLQFFPLLDAKRLPDLCRSHKCDARPSALFQKYRQVARLREAQSVPALRSAYATLQESAQKEGKTLDDVVQKEFAQRTSELVAEAVRPVDAQ